MSVVMRGLIIIGMIAICGFTLTDLLHDHFGYGAQAGALMVPLGTGVEGAFHHWSFFLASFADGELAGSGGISFLAPEQGGAFGTDPADPRASIFVQVIVACVSAAISFFLIGFSLSGRSR